MRIADAPELNDVPWEYLYNAALNQFLALSEHTPLIRYLDLPAPIRPLAVEPPLEILVMISSPTDYPGLKVEQEWSRLNEALAGLIDSGPVRLERLAEARLPTLQAKLRGGEYHILHFIGHGSFDREAQDGVLILCDETGKGQRIAAELLGTLLHDHRSLRLVVLNACEGSRSSRTDLFAGVAQTLVQQGIPAVIAMQFEISDQAAITFAGEFYAATADGYPVDAALSAARKAIRVVGNEIEWGTPVLYLRAPNGQLFSVNRDSARLAAEEKQGAEAARKAPEGTQSFSPSILLSQQLSKTMSNPRYADDLSRLDRLYDMNAVANRETIILVVGTGVPAELLDRPVAELLRDHIDQRSGEENAFHRAIVVTDEAWYAESKDLATKAVIAIGGPQVNKLSDEFDKLPEWKYLIPGTEVLTGFFRKNSRGRPQVALWGKSARGSREAVEHYIQDKKGLSEFLNMVWK